MFGTKKTKVYTDLSPIQLLELIELNVVFPTSFFPLCPFIFYFFQFLNEMYQKQTYISFLFLPRVNLGKSSKTRLLIPLKCIDPEKTTEFTQLNFIQLWGFRIIGCSTLIVISLLRLIQDKPTWNCLAAGKFLAKFNSVHGTSNFILTYGWNKKSTKVALPCWF